MMPLISCSWEYQLPSIQGILIPPEPCLFPYIQQTLHQCFLNKTIPLATSPTMIATFPSRQAFWSQVSVPFLCRTQTSLGVSSLRFLREDGTVEEDGEETVLGVARGHQRLLESACFREVAHAFLEDLLLAELHGSDSQR